MVTTSCICKKMFKIREDEEEEEEGEKRRVDRNKGKCLSCWRQVTLCSWFIILACVENITQMIYNPYLRALIMCAQWIGEGGIQVQARQVQRLLSPSLISLSFSLTAVPFLLPCPTNFNRKWRKTFQKSWKTFTANLACPRLACTYPPASFAARPGLADAPKAQT